MINGADLRLSHLKYESVKAKVDSGQPVTMKELAVFLKVGYSTVRS
jgi:hypothetical protein